MRGSWRFRLNHLTELQLDTLRRVTDHDVRLVVDQLRNLGALTLDDSSVVALTPLGDWGLIRLFGIAKTGEKVATLTVDPERRGAAGLAPRGGAGGDPAGPPAHGGRRCHGLA